jgi:hypothetical protein
MKSSLTFALGLTAVSVMLPPLPSLRADDWKTTDGKVYKNVSVVKAEPDAVTILHQDGGARVPLAILSPDLQKRFHYDPVTAKTAAAAHAQAEADNARVLQTEIDQTGRQRQAALVAEDPRVQNGTLPITTATETTSAAVDSLAATGPTDPTHHSMSQLVDVNQQLRDDHPDDTHHSIAFLKLVTHDLGPDLSDPAHHSMSDLVARGHNLGPDPADPTHHSMGQLFGSDPLARP